MLGSNFALLVRSPGDNGQQLLTTGSRLVCISLVANDKGTNSYRKINHRNARCLQSKF